MGFILTPSHIYITNSTLSHILFTLSCFIKNVYLWGFISDTIMVKSICKNYTKLIKEDI